MQTKSIKKKKHGSFPYLTVVVSSTLSLFVFGYLCSISLSYYRLQNSLKNELKINLYLDSELSEASKNHCIQQIKGKQFVALKNGEPNIKFTSAETIAQEYISSTGENFSDVLGENHVNPFKDVVTLAINAQNSSTDKLPLIKQQLESIKGVFEVNIPKHLKKSINNINKTFNTINIVILSFALLSLLIVLVIIRNSIKLSMYSQRFLIRSMQLVGAKKSFIIRPFIIRSCFNGVISGLLASSLVYIQAEFSSRWLLSLLEINNLESLFSFDDLKYILIALPIAGAIFMSFTTSRAVSKYLKLSLDDLY